MPKTVNKKVPPNPRKRRPGGSGRPWVYTIFRAMVTTPGRQIILLALILAILFWQWSNLQAVGLAL
ncbi:hypothetical protein ACFLWF_02220, partial [Chloroflexota bacterium]